MSDYQYPTYQHYGTNAERLAFVPDPPVTVGIQPIYIWYETDTGDTYLYDTTWHLVSNTSSTTGVTTTGTINVGALSKFSGPSSITSAVLTGDVLSSTISTVTTLSTTGVSAGTYGDATNIPIFTVDAKGRLTAASSTTNPATSAVTTTGTVTTGGLAKFAGPTSITGALLDGDVLGATNSTITTLSTTGVAAGSYGSASQIPIITVDAKGRITSATVAGVVASISQKITFGITIDGNGSVITTGIKGYVRIPVACTISRWTILSIDAANLSGNIVIDLWKDVFANYPPTVADVITGTVAKPTLTASSATTGSTFTGWTTSVSAGDVVGFTVNSVTTVTKVLLSVEADT